MATGRHSETWSTVSVTEHPFVFDVGLIRSYPHDFSVSQQIFNTNYHFSLFFLPAIRLHFLYPDWYTSIYIAVDWNYLLFRTCNFSFFSVGPSRGVTLCHVTFSPLGVMVPLFIVTASFPVDSSSPRDIILFLKSRPSLFVWPSKWHLLRPLVVRVMMINVFVYLRH